MDRTEFFTSDIPKEEGYYWIYHQTYFPKPVIRLLYPPEGCPEDVLLVYDTGDTIWAADMDYVLWCPVDPPGEAELAWNDGYDAGQDDATL